MLAWMKKGCAIVNLPWMPVAAVCVVSCAFGCGTPAKTALCSNDGECEARGDGLKFCLERRCVKCLSSSSCESNKICANGACVDK